MTSTSTTITRNGRRICFSDNGADGRALVLLPGTPGGRIVPEPEPGFFAGKGLRALGLDRPGYGGSDALPGRTVRDVADDVIAVLDHLGIEQTGVLGASGGGPHALAIGAVAPERVAGLSVQVGAVPLTADEAATMVGINQRIFEVAGNRDALLELLDPVRDQILRAGIGSLLPDVNDADRAALEKRAAEAAAVLADALGAGAEGMADDYHAIWGSDWGFAASDVVVPVRWYHGDGDAMVPVDAARRYAEQLPRCAFTSWEGGHLTTPERANLILEEVFSSDL